MEKSILETIKSWICEDDVWDFSPQMKVIYEEEVATYKILAGQGINPASINEVETNIKRYFPRHYFKVQHTLYDLLQWGYHFFKDGTVTLLDIGCGAGTVSLAVIDFYFQIISAYALADLDFPFPKPLKFNFILTDASSHCLLKASYLITKYLQYVVKTYDFTEEYIQIHPIIATFQGKYPDVIPEIKDVLSYTGKANLICFSNVLVQLVNSLKCESGRNDFCSLCSNENTKNCEANKNIIKSHEDLRELRCGSDKYSQVIIIQEKKHWNMIQPILPNDKLSSELVSMKQKNYDPEIKNVISYTAKYGRALYYYSNKT